MEFISHSPHDTKALGERWGREAVRGTVFALQGDLGAGKTQLVKGLARGLGTPARVHSPTFAIVNLYEGGRLPLFHLDLYRLESPEALASAGIEDYLSPDGVTVIEWAERLDQCGVRNAERGTETTAFAGQDAESRVWRRAALEVLDETTRRIVYEDSGA